VTQQKQPQQLSALFVNHAADVLGDTNLGLTGTEIVKTTGVYALEFGVNIPHHTYPFEAANKRTALAENLMKFSEHQRYRIIKELTEHDSIRARNPEAAQKLKVQLMSRYGHLASDSLGSSVNEDLVEQTKHWLDPFPEVRKLYNQALDKHKNGVFVRNLLDDLRLALEKLVQAVIGNDRSLEKQLSDLGGFIKLKGGSTELRNMFVTLIDYYTKYQNSYVKHDDAVNEQEVDLMIELTSSFMKHLVRLS
jgi:hypothetical protein